MMLMTAEAQRESNISLTGNPPPAFDISSPWMLLQCWQGLTGWGQSATLCPRIHQQSDSNRI